MEDRREHDRSAKGMNLFERYLTVWVGLCIVAGIALGKVAPGMARALDSLVIPVKGAPVVCPVATFHSRIVLSLPAEANI